MTADTPRRISGDNTPERMAKARVTRDLIDRVEAAIACAPNNEAAAIAAITEGERWLREMLWSDAPTHISDPAPAALPEIAEGHWSTSQGHEIAVEYASKERAELCHGDVSDFELANAIFLARRYDRDLITFQTAAKERIRWLSAHLAKARGL